MSTITIRNLDPEVKQHIQLLAKVYGRSMEGQIRVLLRDSVGLGVSVDMKVAQQDRVTMMMKEHLAHTQAFRPRAAQKKTASTAN